MLRFYCLPLPFPGHLAHEAAQFPNIAGPALMRQDAKHGIERMDFLLLGNPGETQRTVEESLAFADSLELEALKVTVGIRIYPGTQLEEIAGDQGVITSASYLLFSHLYLSPELEEWFPERLKEWGGSRPSVIIWRGD